MEIDDVTFRFGPHIVSQLNISWLQLGRRINSVRWQRLVSSIKSLKMELVGNGDVEVLPNLRRWVEHELREEHLKAEERRNSLRSNRRVTAVI